MIYLTIWVGYTAPSSTGIEAPCPKCYYDCPLLTVPKLGLNEHNWEFEILHLNVLFNNIRYYQY